MLLLSILKKEKTFEIYNNKLKAENQINDIQKNNACFIIAGLHVLYRGSTARALTPMV